MRNITKIIIHCSDSKPTMDIGVKEIDAWHKDRGWSGIGYHYVIRKDGTVEIGREIKRQGAHCRGHNANSIGICYVGGWDGLDDRTCAQKSSINNLISILQSIYNNVTIHGHNEFSEKTCPNYEV